VVLPLRVVGGLLLAHRELALMLLLVGRFGLFLAPAEAWPLVLVGSVVLAL
jgi:hypothetical protein